MNVDALQENGLCCKIGKRLIKTREVGDTTNQAT